MQTKFTITTFDEIKQYHPFVFQNMLWMKHLDKTGYCFGVKRYIELSGAEIVGFSEDFSLMLKLKPHNSK